MDSELEMVAHAASFSRRWRWLALLYIFVGWWTLFSRRPPLPGRGTHCCIASTVAHWCRQKAINNVACNLFEVLMLLSAMAIKYRYLLLWDSSEITALYLYMLQWIKRYCSKRGLMSNVLKLSLTSTPHPANKIFIHGGD